mgnify:CR=1 FL=1
MVSKKFPEWAITLYRGVRAAVGAGIAQAIILQPDWTDPKAAGRTLLVAFLAGFVTAAGKMIRDWLDNEMDIDEKSIIAKSMPI